MTPIVIEKQKATMDTKTGESLKIARLSALSRSTSEKPMAAQTKPLRVCRIVSQKGMRV